MIESVGFVLAAAAILDAGFREDILGSFVQNELAVRVEQCSSSASRG